MAAEALSPVEGAVLSLNYGFDRVRFSAPVRSGQRIRGRFTLGNVRARSPLELLLSHAVTVDIEGGDKPALVADWLTLVVLRAAGSR